MPPAAPAPPRSTPLTVITSPLANNTVAGSAASRRLVRAVAAVAAAPPAVPTSVFEFNTAPCVPTSPSASKFPSMYTFSVARATASVFSGIVISPSAPGTTW